MRLFVALPLPDAAARSLVAVQGGVPGARWVAAENLHVTLRFIGEVDGAVAADVDAALTGIRAPVFDWDIEGVGKFGSGRHLRMLWAAPVPEAPLAFLAAKVEAALVNIGLAPEGRKFTPHITLARLKGASEGRVAHWLESNAALFAGPFTADRFTLFRSHLGKEAAHYEALADYPLTVLGD